MGIMQREEIHAITGKQTASAQRRDCAFIVPVRKTKRICLNVRMPELRFWEKAHPIVSLRSAPIALLTASFIALRMKRAVMGIPP